MPRKYIHKGVKLSPLAPTLEHAPWRLYEDYVFHITDPSGMGLRTKMPVLRYGTLLIHRGTGIDNPLYNLRHEPTGLKIVYLTKEQPLRRIGELLWNAHCNLFTIEDIGVCIRSFPSWLNKWLTVCEVKDDFINPEEVFSNAKGRSTNTQGSGSDELLGSDGIAGGGGVGGDSSLEVE